MSVTSFEDATKFNSTLIRKALQGAIYVKRYADADPEIKSIWTPTAGLQIPAGYEHVGHVTKKDATAWARDTDTADVESWGFGEPTRRDLTKDVTTLKFVMQESKRRAFELYNGVDLSQVKPDANGNLVMDKPGRPQKIDYRAFVVSKDGDGADAIYFARWLPLCSVSAIEDQTWGEEDELQYGVTLTGMTDPKIKTAVREIWGGPGLDAVGMGFATV